MQKALKLIVLIVALLLAVPTGAAFASQEQEVYRIVGAGYYDIWKHSDGTWQASGKPGDKGRMTEHDYTLPADKLKGFELTRIEVTHNVTEQGHANAHGRGLLAGVPWNAYERDFLVHSPLVVRADKAAEDLTTGSVTVRWTLDLHPVRPAVQGKEALDLKANSHVLEERYQEQVGFAQAVEGWRWYLPVMITWYGVPQAIPDFSAELIPDRFEAQAGQALTGTVRYKLNDDHPQAETAWLRLHHLTQSEHALALQPVNPADAPNAQGHVVFQPGDVKEYRYSFTVQAASQKIIARINPISVSHDKDWSNNRAEAPIVQPCTDVRIAMSRSPDGVRYAGDATRVTAVVTRANDGPAGSVPVRVRITGPGLNYDQTINLARGESRTINRVVTLNDPGSHVYQGSAWPQGIEDCVPANNTGSVTIPVQAAPRYDAGDSKISHELGPGSDWKFGQP